MKYFIVGTLFGIFIATTGYSCDNGFSRFFNRVIQSYQSF